MATLEERLQAQHETYLVMLNEAEQLFRARPEDPVNKFRYYMRMKQAKDFLTPEELIPVRETYKSLTSQYGGVGRLA